MCPAGGQTVAIRLRAYKHMYEWAITTFKEICFAVELFHILILTPI